MSNDWKKRTTAVHGGQRRSQYGEVSEAIFLTQGFVYDSAEQAEARFIQSGDDEFIYARYGNPTVRMFEERIAALEGTEDAFATASGMAAVNGALTSMLRAGDHVVSARALFGSCLYILEEVLTRYGVEVTFVDGTDLDQWRAAIRPDTKAVFFESMSNPTLEVIDIRAVSDLAHAVGALVVVDNVFATPVLQRSGDLGADVIVYSATKHIDGHGRCLGGAVLADADFMNEHFIPFYRHTGPSMSPFNAWVFLNGLETLAIRMEVHSQRALDLARWLDAHPAISAVHYPGLENHPGHLLAKRQQKAFGGVIAFEVNGGQDGAWTVVNNTQLISITANLGDTKSTITHPATTTHARITEEERRRTGIKDGLVRVSVGFEALEDIKADLERGLSAVLAARRQVEAAE